MAHLTGCMSWTQSERDTGDILRDQLDFEGSRLHFDSCLRFSFGQDDPLGSLAMPISCAPRSKSRLRFALDQVQPLGSFAPGMRLRGFVRQEHGPQVEDP